MVFFKSTRVCQEHTVTLLIPKLASQARFMCFVFLFVTPHLPAAGDTSPVLLLAGVSCFASSRSRSVGPGSAPRDPSILHDHDADVEKTSHPFWSLETFVRTKGDSLGTPFSVTRPGQSLLK